MYTGSRRRAGSLVTGPKNNGHERRSPRTSGVAVTYRDLTWQRSPQGIDATLSIWDLRNQLARARASGTPSLSLLDCVEVLLQRAQSARCPSIDLSFEDDLGRLLRLCVRSSTLPGRCSIAADRTQKSQARNAHGARRWSRQYDFGVEMMNQCSPEQLSA